MAQPKPKPRVLCPNDKCPLTVLAEVKATLGWTIQLYGCDYCRFDRVFALAHDAEGNTRSVAGWRHDQDAGLYVLASEAPNNPPGWLGLACAALSQHHQQRHAQGNPT